MGSELRRGVLLLSGHPACAGRLEPGGDRLTDDEVFANILTLLVGGEDTTANTITWMLYYLVSMPAVQSRARQEVDAVVSPGIVPEMAHLKRLPYLAGVAQEVLRMRSTVPLFFMEANRAGGGGPERSGA